MLNSLKRNPIILAICFFSIFTLARLIILGDPSKFIVAGTDFFEANHWQEKIHLEEGQGYDGQFFFHYAHSPFENTVQPHAKVDLAPYRHQRIGYPTLAWIFSFGNPNWIPSSLIFINLLAAIGLSFFVFQLTKSSGKWLIRLAPLLVPGLLMSLSRDLSEVLSSFLLVGSLYFIHHKKLLLFAFFGTFCVLTRETEVVLLGPIILWFIMQKQRAIIDKTLSLLPLIILFLWKFVVINYWYPNYSPPTQNLTFPLYGFLHSFWINLRISSIKQIAEFAFWLTYAGLFIYIFTLSTKEIIKQKRILNTPFPLMIIAGVSFSLIFSEAIYIDDWAFVRVLTSTVIICLLYLVQQNKISKSLMFFLLFTSSITFARLVFRI